MGDSSPKKENAYGLTNEGKSYALSGKIMLSVIIILFFVVVLMVCLHFYARLYLSRARARRRQLRRRSRHRNHLTFYVDPANPGAATLSNRGIEDYVIKSLPVFMYSSKTNPEPVECSVCLSEFEDGETGRVLPKCKHSFHIDCIDMWFRSNSTCPLCRTPIEAPATVDDTRSEVVITVCEPSSGSGSCSSSSSSSGSCAQYENEGEERGRKGPTLSSSSSFVLRRKPSLASMTVGVPGLVRNFSFDESNRDSLSTQSSSRSPMNRMLSFKKMLSRDRKSGVSSSSASHEGGSSLTITDLEMERGRRDEIQRLGDIKIGSKTKSAAE